jgi:hypothetical protein
MIAFACGLWVTLAFFHVLNVKDKIEVEDNVPTRWYETKPGWMLLTYLWLENFEPAYGVLLDLLF